MATIKIGTDVLLENDRRFNKWGKLIRSPKEIDLSKRNGYALTGPFVHWDETVVLNEGEFVLLAAEIGSMKYHSYHYALFSMTDNGPEQIPVKTVRSAIQSADVNDVQRANAANSELYMYALYCSLQFSANAEPQLSADELALVDALKALSPEARQRVLRAAR